VFEGNAGVTAGLPHWTSKSFPDSFVLAGDTKGLVFRQYEPLNLKGPYQPRDGNGALLGGEEYYTYQEDSMIVPIWDKFSVVTLARW